MKKPLILIVDDAKDSGEMYGHYLQIRGFQVELAHNGQEALDEVARFRPDVIIMDLLMPVMDGYEATKRLKADEKTKNIPVVILTAHYFDGAATDLIKASSDGILIKPCAPGDMLKEIVRVMELIEAKAATGATGVQEAGKIRRTPLLNADAQ